METISLPSFPSSPSSTTRNEKGAKERGERGLVHAPDIFNLGSILFPQPTKGVKGVGQKFVSFSFGGKEGRGRTTQCVRKLTLAPCGHQTFHAPMHEE